MKLKKTIYKGIIFSFISILFCLTIHAKEETSKQKTQTFILDLGLNDYNKILEPDQISQINTLLDALKKQFPNGINIALFKEIKGYDSQSNYVKDFIAANKNNFQATGATIFIIADSKYIDLAGYGHDQNKSTYNIILPYENNISENIRTGIQNNNIAQGIKDALEFLVKTFNIIDAPELKSVAETIQKQAKDKAEAKQHRKLIHIYKEASNWQAIVSILISFILILLKILIVNRNEPSSAPKITQWGVDLLYFSLLLSIISSLYLLVVIPQHYLIIRIIKVLLILFFGRIVISKITKGKRWARTFITLWILIFFIVISKAYIESASILTIGTIVIYIVDHSACLLALLFLYTPKSNSWFAAQKKKK